MSTPRGFVGLVVAAVAATLVLSGCAAALMGRAASSGSSSGTTQSSTGSAQRAGSATSSGSASARSAAQIEQDRQVAVSVRGKLAADAGTKSLAVGVDVYQGVVSLHGAVANAGERSAVERVARSVAGVRDVRNELRVR